MSIHEIGKTLSWDLGQDGAIIREAEKDDTPASTPPTSATAANATTFFGMGRANPTVKKGNDTHDYEQKYPEDAPYEETAPNARVWGTYEDESKNHDTNMVEKSRDSVDVLLVFASLFSAVVTTFVAQTYQNLQVNYAAMSASLLYESILVQRAIANGASVNSIAPSPFNPTIPFVPATTDVWVNGLWFTSLFLSLTTTLVAVLVKQWLHHYVALPSGTPRDRSFTRQFRFGGFQKWHVQVIIGLLPVLMHLALAIFLGGLVVFLHPLRAALSWIICAGTAVVYAAYLLAAIFPILFPQCPYRTPLCDLIYISFQRIIPQVTWQRKDQFLYAYKRGNFFHMFRCLPDVTARKPESLTMIESKFVQQTSANLAAEALHWLFSVSSDPIVRSIVIQSIGGLPMSSAEKFQALQGDTSTVDKLHPSLLEQCLRRKVFHHEPVPGMELKLGRLLRFYPRSSRVLYSFITGIDSSELVIAILSNGCLLKDGETFASVDSGAHFMKIIRSSTRLPPRCWYHLMKTSRVLVSHPLDPDHDDHDKKIPLHLCSAILHTLSRTSLMQPNFSLVHDFDSPSILSFRDALPYFLDKFYDPILHMLSMFVKDSPSLREPSLTQSLRVFAVVIKFLLHQISLPQSDKSHTTICRLLITAVRWIHRQTFLSREAAAVITVLEDITAPGIIPPLNIKWDWSELRYASILAYHPLSTVAPSAFSSCGLRIIVDFMTTHWDLTRGVSYKSDIACRVLTNLLAKHIPLAFNVFRESHCLQFLGNHAFHKAAVPLVSKYVAGISAMQHALNGAMDEATRQLHVDYLYNPLNLFTACSILATRGTSNIDRSAIYRDIITLVQLCPCDAAWDECRRKLHDLVQGDGGDFFSEQRVWPVLLSDLWECRQLQIEEIQAEKDNIRYAIHVLDVFFETKAHTMGRLYRFLRWCLRREPEHKQEPERQV
ncbi:hypothetical protein IW261DRAFT_1610339 [Armillaria novae-zelandiae]|uniref:DUF6535 domain-containing protein n=1 Tax=Armillaria novae-zelandiae TaxID=153914 RepID=A0AA39U075_9AGAR|nr:hypothetical protein IW261DRAFT_1610339 [Armillaria novae-zelandiae]